MEKNTIKYMEIAGDIREKILSGEMKPNEQLEFEKDLCVKYGVSKMTMKKAMDILVTEGLIIKRRGYGTFIKDIDIHDIQRYMLANQFRGFTANNVGKKIESQVLDFEIEKPSDEVRRALNAEEDSFVYHIRRIRKLDGQPKVIETTYMPIDIITGIKKNILEGSLYEYIEQTLHLSIQSSHRTIRVRKATEEEAQLLKLCEGDPVAVASQVAYLESGQAFEHSVSITRYDWFEFKTVILR